MVAEPATRLTIGARTDVGRLRDHNEDTLWAKQPEDATIYRTKGVLLIVADGMGGHAAGERASQVAINTIVREYYSSAQPDVPTALLAAVTAANAAVYDESRTDPNKRGMGTTCVATVLRGDRCYVLNVGDSRLYRLRNMQLRQLTQDHSWVAEQVRAGLLSPGEALSHPYKNIVTRSLGPNPSIDADLAQYDLQAGDTLLICSDGLDGPVSDEQIQQILRDFPDPQRASDELVHLANSQGGPDNISAIVVRVDEVVPVDESSRALHMEMGPVTAPLHSAVSTAPDTVPLDAHTSELDTEQVRSPSRRWWLLPVLLLLGISAIVLYILASNGQFPQLSPPVIPPVVR